MKLFRERLLARLIERHAISEELVRKLLAWRHPGFSAHVGEVIPFDEKKAIEGVACYVVRNPLSLKKLIYLDGQKAVLYRSKMNPSLGRNLPGGPARVQRLRRSAQDRCVHQRPDLDRAAHGPGGRRRRHAEGLRRSGLSPHRGRRARLGESPRDDPRRRHRPPADGWGWRWPDPRKYLGDDTPGDASKLHFPSYGKEAAEILVARKVAALGVDTASIDHGPSRDFIVHQIVNGANVAGLENVAYLDELPEWGAWVIALPMKIGGGSGGPVRIVGLVPR